MSVVYLGHSAFLFEDESGGRLLIDPFGNSDTRRWFLKPFPSLEVDLVAVTHEHFDHNAVGALPPSKEVMRGANTETVGQTTISGIVDLHAGPSGISNTIYIIEHEGVRFCHFGDNRPSIPDSVCAALGKIDVLMAPVDDSNHLFSYYELDRLVETLMPTVVIPMHYFIEGLTNPESGLSGPDAWVRRQSPRRPLRRSRFRIDRRGLPYEREVWMVPPLLLY